MDLAERSLNRTIGWRLWLRRLAIVAAIGAVLVAIVLGVRGLLNEPAGPKRQVARIAILPDTPPPPPPPPKDEPKKEPPKVEDRPQMRQEQPKPQEAPPPAPAPIRMEGAAGDGPSAFAAGPVTNEYKSGAPVIGTPASGPTGTGSDRAQERFYANTARQLLRQAIEKHLAPDAGELTASFAIWVEPDGRIRRYEVDPSGDAARDADMRSALGGTAREVTLPPPRNLAQPMRFRLAVRPLG